MIMDKGGDEEVFSTKRIVSRELYFIHRHSTRNACCKSARNYCTMSIVFKSFETLKNSRNLTDEQLKLVLANPCTPSNDVCYEDGLTEILIAWLNAASGLNWRKAFEHSDRGELQYATIQLIDSEIFGNVSRKKFTMKMKTLKKYALF